MATTEKSLQETYAPLSVCFGCGPANAEGLRIRSFPEGESVVATFRPQTFMEAFPGVLAGGIVGTLLDCHCNWTAAYHLMRRSGDEALPSTVTARYEIVMRRPTPTDVELALRARVVELTEDRVEVEGHIEAGGKVTATCRGTFVAVGPGHPAHHRW